MHEVWSQTKEEIDSGLLEGPFSIQELTKMFGEQWSGARRFGIQQGEKVRAMDEFSEFHINDGFGALNTIAILSLDDVVSRSRA